MTAGARECACKSEDEKSYSSQGAHAQQAGDNGEERELSARASAHALCRLLLLLLLLLTELSAPCAW
eukprot:EC786871.1.p4 GENE.EC786871.1~~EC786871.1.p4  ORF type:complete len:67 (-),score=7.07 EC786871.1:9-209(-)